MEVVLLFSKPHDYLSTVPKYLVDKYQGVQCFVYEDKRVDKSYIPSIRPYLWWQYLLKDSTREHEDYFYIDSDVIFREWIDFTKIDFSPNTWAGSNCGHYLDYNYVKQCKNGESILRHMALISGISVDQMKGIPGIGAHLVISHPTALFWEKVYNDSMELWRYFLGIDSNIQKWTAEMWAQLWAMVKYDFKIEAPAELDFCMATDPIEKWDRVKIMHNAGVTGNTPELFFKGKFTQDTPFGKNFSWVDQDKCSAKYVQAIEKVVI